ncbi:MAG: HEAT repeat domain-containing protein, partial [Planctomycetes bacterium]|nr:HEAT repeat domain-containing protein [Planctomycetota bacterium]
VVNIFSDGSLSSQLAALELLKEWKAPVAELDPWNPKSLNLQRLKKLSDWAAQTDHSKSKSEKTELTVAELESARNMILAMISASPGEARAIRERLSRFGPLLLPEVTSRLKTAETDQDRERLTELRYRLVASDRLILEWPGGIERLAMTDLKVRQQAVDELAKRATEQEEDLLLELFSDPAPLIREISLRILQEVGGTSTNSALIRLLDDPEPNVRAAVLKQLAEKPSRSIVPRIAEYVKTEKDPDLVAHAVRLFREAKGNAAIEALVELLSHSSWRVRAESAESISEVIGRYPSSDNLHVDAYMALIELLQDEDSFVVSRAVKALSSTDMIVTVEPLVKAASEHPDLASEIVKVLSEGQKQSVKSIPYLREFCKHEKAEVRAAAITGLCSLVPTDVKEELRQSLKDQESVVRTAAANGFFQLLTTKSLTGEIQDFSGELSDIEIDLSDSAETIAQNLFSNVLKSLGRPTSKGSKRIVIETVTPAATSTSEKSTSPQTTPDPEDLETTNPEKASPEKTDSQETDSKNQNPKIPDATPKTANPAQQHTLQYERNLLSIREGKGRKKWMFEMVPLLEPLLKSKSVEEQLAGALALVGLGRDQAALPVLSAVMKSHRQHISTIASSLPWLLWEDRIELFREFTKVTDNPSDLGYVVYSMAEPQDHRAFDAFWDLLSRGDVNASFSETVMTALKRNYFGCSYYDLDAVSSGAKKLA